MTPLFAARQPRLACACLLMLVCGVSVASAAGPASQPTAADIKAAIEKAKKWVYRQQHAGGHWEKDSVRQGTDHPSYINMQGDTFGGYTALATYALLAAGESPNDPRIRQAVDFLKEADVVGIYAIAMRCQVWLLIPHASAEMRGYIDRDADALFHGVNDGKQNPENKGLWDYLGRGPRVDHSVSQYGVLGLWACQQTGVVNVPPDLWREMELTWGRQQHPDGGWDYGEVGTEIPSMTAAGIATMFIIADYVHAEEAVTCRGNIIHPAIDRGLKWMDEHFDDIRDNAYAMYGIERIGAASGYKSFAGRDWFAELASRLLATQNDDGSWNAGSYPGAQALDNTCFALLFLARGRAPLLVNKLDYHVFLSASTQPVEAHWNERPRDMANLTAWVAHNTETYLQWQIVTLLTAPEDLHDAPVLYLSGSQELELTDADAQKIKTFVLEGGMVLANADCGREAFAKSFQELGRRLFGDDFRRLAPAHPAFTHQQFPAKRWRKLPAVLGLSNGVRELMVLVPDEDPARYWQVPRGPAASPHEEAYELGADLFQYSDDRKPWDKGDSYWVKLDPAVKTGQKIKLARLEVGRNWDPEPGGWWRMGNLLHNQEQLDVAVYHTKLGVGALTAAQVAHLTGTSDFALDDASRLELESFVKSGGTLVIDAAGGSVQFADAAEQELKAMFGPAAVQGLARPLPRTHAVYNLPGHPIPAFSYRPWARLNSVGALKEPRIRGIDIGNRTAIFFSREDLSAGMVGEPVDGIIGYAPETATQIMRNIILYSARPEANAPGATAPATPSRQSSPTPRAAISPSTSPDTARIFRQHAVEGIPPSAAHTD